MKSMHSFGKKMNTDKIQVNRDCREEFRGTAAAYRKRKLVLHILAGCILLPFLLLVTFAPSSEVGRNGFMICMVVLVCTGAVLLRKVCPACRKNVDRSSGSFCPECGADALKKSLWTGFPTCQACTKELFKGKNGRLYKLRFCRNCGAHLDDEGL